ncbi:hypothetical protein [Peribacillus frigoritolerans]|uniref:Uncharacterized protein n=1 Tax=Peribacillus castrilensis TaxID=2897690 RepID=A0AAW9NPH9_9BACI|nr:hypothetical protein [Peribacillus castrilensis]
MTKRREYPPLMRFKQPEVADPNRYATDYVRPIAPKTKKVVKVVKKERVYRDMDIVNAFAMGLGLASILFVFFILWLVPAGSWG